MKIEPPSAPLAQLPTIAQFPTIANAPTKLPNLSVPTPVVNSLPLSIPVSTSATVPMRNSISTRNSVENEDSSETSGIGSSDSGSPEIQNTGNTGSTGQDVQKSHDHGHCCSPKSPAHSCSIPCK